MKDVIVVGYNYSTVLGVVRSVGQAGYGVRLLSLSGIGEKITSESKYVVASKTVDLSFPEFYQALEELRGENERMLIIPAHDRTDKLLDEHAKELSAHYDFPNVRGETGGLWNLMNKMVQKKLAESCGLPVAEGDMFETTPEGIREALQKASFPCLIKPAASASTQTSKDLIVSCKNKDELETGMKHAAERECTLVIVERFLNVEEELSAYGVAFNGKVFIPAYITERSCGYGPHKGIAAEGTVHSAEKIQDTKEKLEAFVRKSGLNGLFCTDLLVSEGKIYFSEMNLRCGASEYAVTEAGANLPGTLVAYYDSKQPNESFQVRETNFVNEKVVLDSYRGGHISLREMLAAIKNNEVGFVKSREDPGPWKMYERLVLRKIAARLIKGPQE